MREHDPQREARRMRNPERTSYHDQFAAVDQSDCRSERPRIKKERGEENQAGTEQLRLG